MTDRPYRTVLLTDGGSDAETAEQLLDDAVDGHETLQTSAVSRPELVTAEGVWTGLDEIRDFLDSGG